jgi:hypothetical protein
LSTSFHQKDNKKKQIDENKKIFAVVFVCFKIEAVNKKMFVKNKYFVDFKGFV